MHDPFQTLHPSTISLHDNEPLLNLLSTHKYYTAMKGMKLFCSSTASTAVNSTMDHHRSTARRSTKRHSSVRRKSQLRLPCSSTLPISPMPHRKGSVTNFNFSSSNNSSGSSSTIYLLSDAPFIDWVSESDQVPSHKQNQVVLRVSLHCKACEGKVRKHISKMEGEFTYPPWFI